MDKNSRLKLILIIFVAVAAVIFSYIFTILYFYNINPYNISAKLVIWPFNSEKSKGELYLDGMVEVSFFAMEDFSETEKVVSGVNINKNGWILIPASSLKNLSKDKNITVKPKSGTPYLADLVFLDDTYNLALLKCKNIEGKTGKIQIPFVKMGRLGLEKTKKSLIFVDNSLKAQDVEVGYTDNENFVVADYTIVDNKFALDYCLEDSFELYLDKTYDDFVGGAVFDENGAVLGLCNGWKLSDGGYVITPIYNIFDILEDAFSDKLEKTELFDSLVGFDAIEFSYHQEISTMSEGDISGDQTKFYFNGEWLDYNMAMEGFLSGFMLLEDFSFDEIEIPKYSIIKSIQIEEQIPNLIDSRLALHDALYKVKKGDSITVKYENLGIDYAETITL